MWQYQTTPLARHPGWSGRLNHGGVPASYSSVMRAWQEDEKARMSFLEGLAQTPCEALYWEVAPVAQACFERPFEFVVLQASGLAARSVDAATFSPHFSDEHDVVQFANLGGDALLVVPCPRTQHSAYTHLASFVRKAPEAQRHQLLSSVARAVERKLSPEPLWLSTAGGGVSWLHVRLDRRPKYYRYGPYRSASP